MSLFFAVCIATISVATENKKSQPHDFKLIPASKGLQISGTVQSVNMGAGTITVTKKFKDKSIEVIAVTDQETKITKGDEKKNLNEIKAGDKAIVVYTKKGEVNLAKSITIR
jgi:hypothetical protein